MTENAGAAALPVAGWAQLVRLALRGSGRAVRDALAGASAALSSVAAAGAACFPARRLPGARTAAGKALRKLGWSCRRAETVVVKAVKRADRLAYRLQTTVVDPELRSVRFCIVAYRKQGRFWRFAFARPDGEERFYPVRGAGAERIAGDFRKTAGAAYEASGWQEEQVEPRTLREELRIGVVEAAVAFGYRNEVGTLTGVFRLDYRFAGRSWVPVASGRRVETEFAFDSGKELKLSAAELRRAIYRAEIRGALSISASRGQIELADEVRIVYDDDTHLTARAIVNFRMALHWSTVSGAGTVHYRYRNGDWEACPFLTADSNELFYAAPACDRHVFPPL